MATRAAALTSVQTRAYPAWAYWHLLSLDAPTVAVVWCCAFAQAAGVRVPLPCLLALAATVWILYVADRLQDARHTLGLADMRERHWFHAEHRRGLLAVLTAVAAFDTVAAIVAIPAQLLQWEAVLAVAAAVYFARVHWGSMFGWRGLSAGVKELHVGVIFAVGVALPAATQTAELHHLLGAIVAFAALCALNCLVIERAESGAVTVRCNLALAGLALLCLLQSGPVRPLFLELALAALLLLAVCCQRQRMSPLAFRVAADAALLAPLLLLHAGMKWKL